MFVLLTLSVLNLASGEPSFCLNNDLLFLVCSRKPEYSLILVESLWEACLSELLKLEKSLLFYLIRCSRTEASNSLGDSFFSFIVLNFEFVPDSRISLA
jgi:hypothetical protein